jgi:hypothetical protein
MNSEYETSNGVPREASEVIGNIGNSGGITTRQQNTKRIAKTMRRDKKQENRAKIVAAPLGLKSRKGR